MRRFVFSAALSVLATCAICSVAGAVTLDPIGKFAQPISVSSDPGNPQRLLVAEREGVVDEVIGGAVTPIADISSLVSCCESERGLLSIVPAPDFDSSGRIYIAYTGTSAAGGSEGDIHVDSFRIVTGDGSPIRQPILSVGHAANANHNGGQLQFGPDGHLYISTGDGGGSRRLTVRPPGSRATQRSQVRTIALAKPRP